ncbi:MAG: glycosyltransferase family 39 protein [Flavobacteriales bacterium]|nr:glycosyltransferase family 39 protein [Flavobacteriales bacterium]
MAEITFFSVIFALFFILGYFNHLFDGPGGIHYIRQTDSLAFIDHYAGNGHNFFKPGTLNLDSEDGNAACEFPLIYYLISFLYSGFGKHYFFLRLVNFLIITVGLFNLFKLGEKTFENKLTAFLPPFFLFTSTVFNYYAFNYLPDAAALGFTFVGWNIFYNVYFEKQEGWWKPFLFFTLAGLIKVTYLISPIAIVCYFIFKHFKGIKYQEIKSLIIMFLISITVVGGWNIYVVFYNHYFETEYFTTGARPIWGMPDSEVTKTWDHIFNFWWNDYFAHSSQHIIAVLLVLNFILLRKIKNIISLIVLMLMGAVCYFLLFFSQFKDHDYYFLTLIPVITVILGGGIYAIIKTSSNKYVNWCMQGTFIIIILIGINYSREKVNLRFDQRIDHISSFSISLEQNDFEISLIPQKSKVLVIEDLSKNGSLLILDRKGWTLPDRIYFTDDTLNHYLNKGLTHIVTPPDLNLEIEHFSRQHYNRSDLGICNIYSFHYE